MAGGPRDTGKRNALRPYGPCVLKQGPLGHFADRPGSHSDLAVFFSLDSSHSR